MDELVGLSDCILVLRGSTLVEEFPAPPISKEGLIAAVVGSRLGETSVRQVAS
jgi:ABC-type sugar transport system ATPase subunit